MLTLCDLIVLYLKVYHVCEVKAIKYFRKGVCKLYEKFADLLEKTNKTTYRVAMETGIPQNVFSNWKTGRSNPKVDKLKILADYFGVSIEYFLE